MVFAAIEIFNRDHHEIMGISEISIEPGAVWEAIRKPSTRLWRVQVLG
jgi:hypothetical protein